MEHLAKPLAALAQKMGAFITSEHVRVLHIATDEALAEDVRDIVLDYEWHAGNTRPFYWLDAPYVSSETYWQTGIATLLGLYERQKEAFEAEACSVPERPTGLLAGQSSVASATRFAQTIAALGATFRSEDLSTEGIVIVLAPSAGTETGVWGAEVRVLVEALAPDTAVRWIVLERATPTAPGLQLSLGEDQQWTIPCFVDEALRARDVDKLLANAAAAARGAGLAKGAKPSVAVPRHPSDPGGPPPGGPPHLPPFLEATHALNRGDIPGSLPLLREAWKLATGAGLPADAVAMGTQYGSLLALGALSAGPGQRAPLAAEALAVLAGAAKTATDAGLHAEAAQAHLAHATTSKAFGELTRAAGAFRLAAEHAKAANLPSVELFALSAGGELAAAEGSTDFAGRLWQDGVAAGARVPASSRSALAIPEHLEALAKVATKYGRGDIAQSARAVVQEEEAPC